MTLCGLAPDTLAAFRVTNLDKIFDIVAKLQTEHRGDTPMWKWTVAVALYAVVFSGGAPKAKGKVLFGYNRTGLRTADANREFSRKGCFFATTDFGERNEDWDRLTRAHHTEQPCGFPTYNRPWMSDGSRTLFGLEFSSPIEPNWPGQFDRFPERRPRFNRVVVQWGENVPAKDGWSACVQTCDGEWKRIKVDAGRTVYPYDRTTIHFVPTVVKKFYIGLKGRQDGVENAVEVRDIKIYLAPDDNTTLTNSVAVWHPGFFLAVFSTDTPGMIEGLTPVNAFCNSHHTLYYHPDYVFDLFFRMTPFVEFQGQTVLPRPERCSVTTSEAEGADTLKYTLTFDLPGKRVVEVAATSIFREASEQSLETKLRADGLPAGAKLGYRFLGPAELFGKMADAVSVLAGPAVSLASAAGRTRIELRGASAVALARDGDDRVRFETVAQGKELALAFSLPIGAAGQPQPELCRYRWRPSAAGDGDEGVAPFKMSDLKLIEEIDCGDPNDPHECYDLSNDPVIDGLRASGKLEDRRRYGFMPLADHPQGAAIPITTIAGQRVRAIPGKRGVYFRVDLDTKLKSRTPYLVVVEHAFDKRRRGTFYSILLDKDGRIRSQISQILRGGFETGLKAEGTFKREAVLCYYPLKRSPPEELTSSIVFTADWGWQGWEEAPGLAIRRIRLYQVETMPALPDLAPLLPPSKQQRSLLVLSELCGGPNPWWLFQWPKLVGYDGVWTYHDPMSRLLGGSSNLERHFHPGTLAGNTLLLQAADEQALTVNMHLGQLLNLGFGNGDTDSFTGSFHGSYNGNSIPFKPTKIELAHIGNALRHSLGILAKYRSLKEVALADNTEPLSVWTERNLRDFCQDTGVAVRTSPLYLNNMHSLLERGPAVIDAWQQWACRHRHEFHRWLLDEVRKYRPDLRIVLSRSWYRGVMTNYESVDWDTPGVTKDDLAAAGIQNVLDFLRFTGLDPALYADDSAFSLELETGAKLRVEMQGPLPNYYRTDWFQDVRDHFRIGGLSMMVNDNYDESIKPLEGKVMTFFKNRGEYRRGLLHALLFANARNITLPTYVEPWSGRIDDLRQFAVPYRLLPFAEPQAYRGKLTDSASQAVVYRYGNRYGLINNGPKPTTARLTLPPEKTSVIDLSEGFPRDIATNPVEDGSLLATVEMSAWSLRTLEMR